MLIADPKSAASPAAPWPWRRWASRSAWLALVGVVAFAGARLGNLRSSPIIPSPGNPVQAAARQVASVFTVYTFDAEDQELGQGSGFVVGPDGLGVTNLHVLEDAQRAEVKLANGQVWEILRIHAHDDQQDLVVIQFGRSKKGESGKGGTVKPTVEWPKDLPALTVAVSTSLQVGDRIATVGAPQGLANTVTDGLVSSIREEGKRRLLQITAPISHGSSGGPVFDTQGQVVAIATSQMDEGQNLNFAVPSDALLPLLKRRDGLTLARLRQKTAPKDASGARNESCFRLGQQLYDEGRYREALEEFFHAQEDWPSTPDAYYEAAQCYLRLGATELAARQYYRFLMFTPEDDRDREGVIDWMRKHGKRVPPL